MNIVDVGTGAPVVLVPGIQGRWEWMRPAVEALAKRCRVVTFSLADEPTSGARFDETSSFSCYVEQIADALDATGVRHATICGVSYGGVIAAAFAARHPERVSALILVSPIPPSWQPDARARFFLRAPWLLSPLFCVASLRMYREISAAVPGFAASIAAAARHLFRALTNMFSPGRMARRARMRVPHQSLERVNVPTLVITGEPLLDQVVPVARSLEYLRIWPHARQATIARTGHIGLITRPDEFARIVVDFMKETFGVLGSSVLGSCSRFDQAHETTERRTRTKNKEPKISNDVGPIREIPGPAGPLETIVDTPVGAPRAAVVFAHPLPTRGGTMHTKVVFQCAKALAGIGCVVLRFNFRGVGLSAGAWDDGRGELDDYRAAIDFMAGRHPGLELWAAGFSFGSNIAMTCGADDDRVCALIGIAPPVERYEFASVRLSTKPKFIIQGERDELVSLTSVREFYGQLQEPKELVVIDRANHLFEGQSSEVGDALQDLLADFSCTTP